MSNVSEHDSAFNINASQVNNSHHYLVCPDWPHCATRELDTAGWLFEKKESKSNLTVIAALALFFFVVLVCLRIHKWYKDSARLKARGDVEFGDESEVNYGIIKEGDEEFCKVEIRSDTTSVYDTVNSFRLFGNGHATCIGATPMFQRGDASHYDSVKSYKAFLKQVTQDKNLDVEVKLLENYPVKCKSVERCYIVEEEHGPSQTSKLKLLPGNVKTSADGKKKSRYRRASGEPLGPMRKRSASNPTYSSSRSGASSLPSIHYSVSSDSSNEEETRSAFRVERRKAFEDRSKKMSRSCSGGKLSKVSKSLDEEQETNATNPKRKRHYSADGGSSRLGKPLLGGFGSIPFRISRAFQHELNNLRESISETEPKPEEHVLIDEEQEETSSENPDSSPSSRNSSFSSDAIQSESDNEDDDDDDETKLVTQISAVSDCTTFNSNELASSVELLSNHSANSDGFTLDLGCSVIESLPSSQQTCKNDILSSEMESCRKDGETLSTSHMNSNNSSSDRVSHAHKTDASPECNDSGKQHNESTSLLANDVLYPAAKNNASPLRHSPNYHFSSSPTVRHKALIAAEVEESEDTDNSVASNPRRVKRFHVTSVQKDDLSSVKSDCLRNSSGGNPLDS